MTLKKFRNTAIIYVGLPSSHRFPLVFLFSFVPLLFNSLSFFFFLLSFSARNSVLIPKILSTWSEFKRFHLNRWVLIRPRVRNESALSGRESNNYGLFMSARKDSEFWFDDSWHLVMRFIAWPFVFLLQRLLKMVDGLNFKDFVAFLSAFSTKASIQQKIEREYWLTDLFLLFYSILILIYFLFDIDFLACFVVSDFQGIWHWW